MAESLGAVVLSIGVDDKQFQAGLQATINKAQRAGEQITRALEARQAKVAENQAKIVRLQREALTADASRASLLRQQAALIENENKAQRAGIAILREKLVKNEALNKSIQQQAAAQAKTRQSQLQAAGAFAGAATGLGGLSTAGAALAGGAFLSSSIKQAAEFETITRKLNITLGTQGTAGALVFTKNVADRLGLSYKQLSSDFGSFTAAATAANVPLQTQKDVFVAVATAGQRLGLTSVSVAGTLQALQQIASKGTVSLEELRQQLGDRLPIAIAATADGLGITQKELFKLVETGKLSAAQFFPALTKGLNDITKASANAAPTAEQSFQKLGNAWNQLQVELGNSLLPTVISQINKLTKLLTDYRKSQEAADLGFANFNQKPGLLGGSPFDITKEADKTLQVLGKIEETYNLTRNQSKGLFEKLSKEVGLKKDPFGTIIPEAQKLEAIYQRLPVAAKALNDQTNNGTLSIKDRKQILSDILDIEEKIGEARSSDVQKIAEINTAIEGTRASTIEAFNKLTKLQQPGSGATKKEIGEALGLVESAAEKFDKLLRASATDVASILIDAVNKATNAREALAGLQASPDQGLNQFLTPEQRQLRLNSAIDLRGQDLERAISIGSSILKEQGLSFNKSLIEELRGIVRGATGQRSVVGSVNGVPITAVGGPPGSQEGFKRIDDFINAVFQENQARVDLNTATQNLADINSSLSTVNAELATQVQQLAQKDWQVYVTVPGAQVAGDVVGAVTGLR